MADGADGFWASIGCFEFRPKNWMMGKSELQTILSPEIFDLFNVFLIFDGWMIWSPSNFFPSEANSLTQEAWVTKPTSKVGPSRGPCHDEFFWGKAPILMACL